MNPIVNKSDFEDLTTNLRDLAYSYLEKYSPSKQQLKVYLLKKYLTKIKGTKSKTSIALLHSGFEDAKSKSPPRVAPLPNLIPLPSCTFFLTLSSTLMGVSFTSALLYIPQEFNKKVVKPITVINFNRFAFMKIIDTRK